MVLNNGIIWIWVWLVLISLIFFNMIVNLNIFEMFFVWEMICWFIMFLFNWFFNLCVVWKIVNFFWSNLDLGVCVEDNVLGFFVNFFKRSWYFFFFEREL